MTSSPQTYRLLTRSDFDGLVCAILLKELGILGDIKFVHPKDMQDGIVDVTENANIADAVVGKDCPKHNMQCACAEGDKGDRLAKVPTTVVAKK